MSKLKIGVVVGSNSKQSINRKLGEGLAKLIQDQADVSFIEIGRLPLYNRDFDGTPEFKPFEDLKAQVRNCDGLLFITPEHNRSIPAPLKTALAGLSRPYGQAAGNGIPAAVIWHIPAGPGHIHGLSSILRTFLFSGLPPCSKPEGFRALE